MKSTRLEAFSDGVFAILITILVLELRIPHGDTLADLQPVFAPLTAYVLSFIYLGIYWNNHHHLLTVTEHVHGKVLWANLHLLFWLSLLPFATGWMGENHFSSLPTALYGIVLLCAAVAYTILQNAIVSSHEKENKLLKQAIGKDLKGKVSIAMNAVAIPLAFWNEWLADALYVAVAAIWFIPDRRIEDRIEEVADEAEE